MTRGFLNDFRRFFVRGLAVILPPLLTIVIIVYVCSLVNNYFGQYINMGVQWLVIQYWCLARGEPLRWTVSQEQLGQAVELWRNYHLWWIGFVLAFVGIYVVGRFMASFLGRGAWRIVERTFFSLPVIKAIYPYVKQVTDFLLSERRVEFSRVVAVEYPRKGIWSLGLVTGPGMRTLQSFLGSDLLTVFVPSSPTPVTGYTISVRREEVIDLPISIEDALKFMVSGGVIMPLSQKLSEAETEQALQGKFPPFQGKEISE